MTDPLTLTTERRNHHGDWNTQALLANLIKKDMHSSPGWTSLPATKQEALDMIATKISRILSGNPFHDDHWDDIAGYAFLAKAGHQEQVTGESNHDGQT